METMTASPVKKSFLSSLANHKSSLLNHNPALVEQSIAAIEALDFPTTRSEDWKYTRTTRISNEQWRIIENKNKIDVTPYLIPDLNADILVFVNGFYREDLSHVSGQHGVNISGWNSSVAVGSDNMEAGTGFFNALNIAYCTSALCINVAKNVAAEKSIHILHIISDEKAMAQARIAITAEPSAQLHIAESFVSAENVKSFSGRFIQIHVGENAGLYFDKIQMEGDDNFLLNEDDIRIESNGRFTINTLTVDGGWVRNNLSISLDAPNIEANLNGIFLPRKKQHIDNHTKVDHRFAHCNSNELYKGLLNDQSTGVFNGKVYVRPNAQKTNAYQSNSNILLSDDAVMNTKPELEIYADDVKCSHGTTTGQMDEEALFYLKSRGIGADNAKRLLTTAFISDVLEKVNNRAVKKFVIKELVKRHLLSETL